MIKSITSSHGLGGLRRDIGRIAAKLEISCYGKALIEKTYFLKEHLIIDSSFVESKKASELITAEVGGVAAYE